ncbi:D-isomer specific 2-hydroxyacid dehydrogenase [Sordaria brevicollis]|uniref:D-3-phosphoglycerate dehydrogenase n=1 Tax=Sordaria brevicollis TaxID=83679 RepID=A0AAE0PME7_SORBR|nr:D-isomer specific 2-hydroxyacid dehydrogenase [Sordaria brevicollis]
MSPSAITPPPSSPTTSSPTFKILIPEPLSEEGLTLLRSSTHEVTYHPKTTPETLASLLPSYHALIIRSETKVTASLLSPDISPNLRVIARAGVGVDNINVEAATKRGIIVVNSPHGNIAAAAEHTIALLLATARNVGRADAGMKTGKWERSKLVGVEVGGKTLGIIGLGKVGMKVARMATGLGMKVLGLDPYASPEIARSAGVKLIGGGGMEELLKEVDFLTVHTPLLASTADMIGEKELRLMKRTARVLNVARGGVYNEAALLKALEEGWIAGAGIDVYTQEPVKFDEESTAARLARHPKVVATPHLGASTVEAQENVSMDVCTQVLEILRGGMPTAAVNAPLILPEEYRRLEPFVKLIERMASLYTQHFARKKPNRLGGRRFELTYHGALASVPPPSTRPLTAALIKGLLSSISSHAGRDVNIVNASLIARERGIAIDEKFVRDNDTTTSTSGSGGEGGQVTLRSLLTSKEGNEDEQEQEQVIEGVVTSNDIFISKLDRFAGANFQPEGTLLVLRNYDRPGKIGGVGMVVGRHGINIRFMQVAGLSNSGGGGGGGGGTKRREGEEVREKGKGEEDSKEALMILGVEGDVTEEVVRELTSQEGILDVSLVRL